MKEPFDIKAVIRRVRKAVEPFPKAMLFQIAEEGYTSPFEQLVACIISIRTLDEVSYPESKRLLGRARTPSAMADLSESEIDGLINKCTFHEAKAKQIRGIARRCVAEFGGNLPCDYDVLTSFNGVGPKCANLTIGIACDKPVSIGVDIHVHRVTNRWGFVTATTPEKTMAELQAKLPKRYWVEINALLVPFGKHVCTGKQPKCSTCPALSMCRQVGVTTHR
jgi:endonuclease-3